MVLARWSCWLKQVDVVLHQLLLQNCWLSLLANRSAGLSSLAGWESSDLIVNELHTYWQK